MLKRSLHNISSKALTPSFFTNISSPLQNWNVRRILYFSQAISRSGSNFAVRQVSARTSRGAKKYTDGSFHFSFFIFFIFHFSFFSFVFHFSFFRNLSNMMVPLCKLAIKSKGTRFRLLWTMK